MFNDVKNLIVGELEQQINDLKKQESDLKEKKWQLEDEMVGKLEEQLQNLKRKLPRLEKESKVQYNLLEKIFNHNLYKKHKSDLAEYKVLPQKIAKLESEIEIAKMQVANKFDESHFDVKFETIEKEIFELRSLSCRAENAVTLAELNVKPVDAVSMLEKNGIQPVLDDSDRKIFERPRNYQSKADLIAVHKTRFMPTESRLSTQEESKVTYTDKVVIDQQEYQYSYPVRRNTLHVALNDEVSSHAYGGWEDCQYTVLQPFDEIPSAKIGAAMPSDTYTRGGIDLSQNAWLLCPQKEVEKAKQQNPNVHVIGYKGENSSGLAAPFLSQLGYRAESVNAWGWDDYESQKQFYDVINQEELHLVHHSASTDAEDEELRVAVDRAISFYKMLRDQNLVQNSADYERIKPQISKCNAVTDLGIVCHSTNVEKKNIDDTAIVGNGRAKEYFMREMQKAGVSLSMEDCQNLMKENANVSTIEQIMINSALRACKIEAEREM